jgi:uncharacterized SAM-binding protein YcdF (DUF218 family)
MKIIRLLLSLIVLTWIGGFFYFKEATKDFTLESKTITDAIVVFGGNKNGLYVGAQLLRLGYAPLVYITGKKPAEEYNNFLKSQKLVPEQFIFDVSFAGDNDFAKETATFLKKYHFDTIRLVVSADQMPRALIEVRALIPASALVIPHPISRKNNDYNALFIEYNKLLLTYLYNYFGLARELNLPYS